MTGFLFRPFRLSRWFIVGFSAFLAYLGEGGYSPNINPKEVMDHNSIQQMKEAYSELTSAIPTGTVFLLVFGIFVVAMIILILWISSRGKFVFLDNVIHEHEQITEPWKEFRKEGNSLFLWRVGFTFLMLAFIGTLVFFLYSYIEAGVNRGESAPFWIYLSFLAVFLATVLYIDLYLNHFVVPIMYKRRTGVLRGWHVFLELWARHPWPFLLYGIIMLGMGIGVFLFVMIAGLLTCCIGFIFLVIPYFNRVITLPFLVWFRAMSLYFLEEFGEEYKLLEPVPEISERNGDEEKGRSGTEEIVSP